MTAIDQQVVEGAMREAAANATATIAALTELLEEQQRVARSGPFRRRFEAHKLALAVATSGLVTALAVFVRWFHTGAFYARGDLAPFIRDGLRSELGWQWTHQNTGAGGPTYDLVRAVEIVFSNVGRMLGGGDPLGERLLFTAIFALAATGIAALAARFTDRAWIVLGAGVIGAFSPFIMVNLPNVLVPLAVGLVAWFTALTIDAAAAGVRRARPRAFALLTIWVAYLALNPPLLMLLTIWVVLLPIVAATVTGTRIDGIRRAFRFLGHAAAWTVPLALWWIVPYLFAMHSATDSGLIAANTDVFSWSWTHAHGSLDRVLALVAKWSWPDTTFGANGSMMARPLLLVFAFALPFGLLAAPLLARPSRQRRANWVLLAALVIAFVAKGLNAPLRDVNAWAYRHVPGMFLIREPMSKVGVFLALAVLMGWVLSVDGVAHRVRRSRQHTAPADGMWRTALVALIVAPAIFAFPMLSGAVVKSRDDIHVPNSWYDVARTVNSSSLAGKALVLPLDDFYQVPTTWGYYGADTIAVELFRRATITRNPQRYIGDAAEFEDLLQAAQDAIVGGQPAAVPGILRALGVSQIVVRKDIDFASPLRRVEMARPEALGAGLREVDGARRVLSNNVADVFEFASDSAPVVALNGTIAAPGARGEALAALVSGTPNGLAVATSAPDAAPLARGVAWYVDTSGARTITVPSTGDWSYQWHTSDAALVEARRTPQGFTLHQPVAIEIGGQRVASRPDATFGTTAPVAALAVDKALLSLDSGRAFFRVNPGTVVQPYSQGGSTDLGSWGPVSDCNRADTAPAQLSSSIVATPQGSEIRLGAARHSACVSAPVLGAAAGDVVRMSLDQRTVSGAAPRTCLWLAGPATCAPLTWRTSEAGKWFALSATFLVPKNAGTMRLYLYADGPASGTSARTEVSYRNVSVTRLVPGAPITLHPAPLPSGQLHLEGGVTDVATTFDAPAPAIGTRSDVGDCARSSDASLSELGITADPLGNDPTSVRLSAQRDSACVSFPLTGLEPSMTYELSFDGQVMNGSPPRICVFEEAQQHCAHFDAVEVPPSGQGRYRFRGRIDEGESNRRLYLYADSSAGATTIEYRNVRVRAIADDALVLRPTGITVGDTPRLSWRPAGPARYHVHVAGVGQPFILALADAYSPSWHITGLPGGATVRQVQIDGYRNGWLIDARGDLDLTVAYAPARWGRLAIVVSQITIVALLLTILVVAVRRHRRRLVELWHTMMAAVPFPRAVAFGSGPLRAAPRGSRRVPVDLTGMSGTARPPARHPAPPRGGRTIPLADLTDERNDHPPA